MRKFFYLFITLIIFINCNSSDKNSSNKKTNQFNYSNSKQLDSLILVTNHSQDSIFLGFKFGINKIEFQTHIKNLKNDNIYLKYSKQEKFNTLFGDFIIEDTYKFNTEIIGEYYGKQIIGNGTYYLKPYYVNGILNQLEILELNEWENGYDAPSWLLKQIKNNINELEDQELKSHLIKLLIINENDFIGSKNDYIVYKKGPIINYIEKKALFQKMFDKIIKENHIKNKSQKIKV